MKFASELGGKRHHHHAKKSHKLMKKMAKLEKKLSKYNFDSSSSENDSSGDDHDKPRSRSRSKSQKRMWARRYRHHKFERHCRSSSSSDSSSDSSDSLTFSSSSSRSPSPRYRRLHNHHQHRHRHGPGAVHFSRSRSFAGHDSHSPGRHHRHERHGGRYWRRHHHAHWAQHGIEGRLFRILAQSEPNLPDVSSERPRSRQEVIDLGSPVEPEAPVQMDEEVQVVNEDDAATAESAAAEGAEIDETLAENWTRVVREGLPLDTRKSLLKKYPVSKNCKSLRAPKLNAEILTIATEAAIKRDTVQAIEQLQVGTGLAALGQAITRLSSKPEIRDQIADCMETLNEAAVIFLNVHNDMSKVRQAFMKPELCKKYRSVVDDCKPDEFLYGKDCGEKLKSGRVCKKKFDKQGCSKAEKRKHAPREWDKKKSKRVDSLGPFKKGF